MYEGLPNVSESSILYVVYEFDPLSSRECSNRDGILKSEEYPSGCITELDWLSRIDLCAFVSSQSDVITSSYQGFINASGE